MTHTIGTAYIAEHEYIVSREPLVVGKKPSQANDGSFTIMLRYGPDSDDVKPLCAVSFHGAAKRGQAWQTPDPEGEANARRIVELWNAANGEVKP